LSSKKWCIGLAPFRDGPGGQRLMDIPPGVIIDTTGRQQVVNAGEYDVLWSEITYRGTSAWVNDTFLEDYVEKYPNAEVLIPHPTAEPNDAAQYMILDGRVKYNMCGELCCAFIGGDDIETFLKKWEQVSPSYYKWALYGDSDKATGVDALESMLKVYNHPFPITRFQAGLTDPIIGFRITPGRIARMLEKHYLIAGVRIDNLTGKLRGQGVGHWVVLDKIKPYGVNGGWVELYNPFPNRRQEYSYDEFIDASSPNWSGIWVSRVPPR